MRARRSTVFDKNPSADLSGWDAADFTLSLDNC